MNEVNERSEVPEAAPERRVIAVALDVPSPAWSVRIESAHAVEDAIWVVAQLERADGMFAQMISTVSDRVSVEASAEAAVRVFVLGKQFGWTPRDDYAFPADLSELAPALESAQPLPLFREDGEE